MSETTPMHDPKVLMRLVLSRGRIGKPGDLPGDGEFSPEQVREAAHEFCTYHAPTGDKPARFAAVSKAVEDAIVVLVEHVPPSGDRTAAIRMLADARMVANRAISLDGAF